MYTSLTVSKNLIGNHVDGSRDFVLVANQPMGPLNTAGWVEIDPIGDSLEEPATCYVYDVSSLGNVHVAAILVKFFDVQTTSTCYLCIYDKTGEMYMAYVFDVLATPPTIPGGQPYFWWVCVPIDKGSTYGTTPVRNGPYTIKVTLGLKTVLNSATVDVKMNHNVFYRITNTTKNNGVPSTATLNAKLIDTANGEFHLTGDVEYAAEGYPVLDPGNRFKSFETTTGAYKIEIRTNDTLIKTVTGQI
jgi:hypothetical protein